MSGIPHEMGGAINTMVYFTVMKVGHVYDLTFKTRL